MKIDRTTLHKLYMEAVHRIAEECDWKSSFTAEECVHLVCTILEENPQLIKTNNESD